MVHYLFHKDKQIDHILSQFNPAVPCKHYFPKIQYYHPTYAWVFEGVSSLGVFLQNYCIHSSFFHCVHFPFIPFSLFQYSWLTQNLIKTSSECSPRNKLVERQKWKKKMHKRFTNNVYFHVSFNSHLNSLFSNEVGHTDRKYDDVSASFCY